MCHSILGVRMRAEVPQVEEVLARPGRYRAVRDNLEVKEVLLGADRQAQRYVIWRNPDGAERDRARRELVLAELEVALSELDQTKGAHQRRACALRISRRFGRCGRQLRNGNLELNRGTIAQKERLDGKYLIHTSDQSLSTEEVALGYNQLLQVERGWRDLEQQLELRPMFHRKDDRIRSLIVLSFLGLPLVRVAEYGSYHGWGRLSRELRRVALVEFSGPAVKLQQTSKLTPSQAQVFEALPILPPLRVRAASNSSKPIAV